MRYDKAGNYDAAHDRPRQVIDAGRFSEAAQMEYDAHYDHAAKMRAGGATANQLMYFDPDLRRTLADYLAVNAR